MARKKPPHDPATGWEPDLDTGDIMHLVNALTLNSNQWLSRFPQSPPRGPVSTNWAQQVLAPQAQANHGGIGSTGYVTAGGTICWEDVEVGQDVPFFRIDWGGVSAISGAQQLPSDSIVYTLTDGSSATYDPASGIITRTSASSPPPSPEEIEETTEVLTGWRVFTIRDYKLRGTWSTWGGRVFHASCNCKEFEESFHGGGPGGDDSFDLHESRRDDLRRHLAAGIGTCGVYSRKKLNPFWYPDSHYRRIFGLADPQVIARCVNYGLGYEYSDGYRSEYCRIEHLWLLAKGPLEHAPFPDSGFLRHVVPGTPGAVSPETVAQVLSTTYGVPCDVMTPLEFAYKDEEGLL